MIACIYSGDLKSFDLALVPEQNYENAHVLVCTYFSNYAGHRKFYFFQI